MTCSSYTKFKRREGTAGISGHLYETKLISLLYFRAIHEDAIEDLQLASNVDNIGAFDDICFKTKIKGFNKPMLVFIQAKHKENNNQTLTIDLLTYFISYLKIRQRFDPNNKDLFFKGSFDETECFFIIYTTARDEFSNDSEVGSSFCSTLNYLIDTDGTAKQPYRQKEDEKNKDMYRQEEDLISLCEVAMKTEVTALAERIAKCIDYEVKIVKKKHGSGDKKKDVKYKKNKDDNVEKKKDETVEKKKDETVEKKKDDSDDKKKDDNAKKEKDVASFQNLLDDEIVQRYHVILAQKVFDISDKQPDGHRVASFRHDFFEPDDKYLKIFKDALCKKILKNNEILVKSTDIGKLLSEFLKEPTDAEKLSKVIGTVITCNNGLLDINKNYTEYFTPHLKQVYVSQQTVDEAEKLAVKKILLPLEFKLRVPSSFGNKDITLSGSYERKKKRINHLTTKITDLLEKCLSSKIVTIDESLDPGFLLLNGGIAGAIGNIFVLDGNSKLMKITDDLESLGTLAKQLYESLNEKIELINKDPSRNKISLREYRFSFRGKQFPKLLLERSEYEENLATDFFNKLVFYSKQANEKEVEKILKSEIELNLALTESFQVKIDETFLKYHNEIQKWWMLPKEADYLTKDGQLFKKASILMIADRIISLISVPYMTQMKQYNYTFTDDAVSSLNLHDKHLSTIIVAENSILTIAKVMQHLKTIKKDYIAIDIEHIVSLPAEGRVALRKELWLTNKDKVLIFVCDKTQVTKKEKIIFTNVAEAVQNKRTIIITNNITVETLQGYFDTADIVHDEKNSLIDMSEESQTRILKSTKVQFQGIEVGLESFVNGWPKVDINS